jgi:hypothetical protein
MTEQTTYIVRGYQGGGAKTQIEQKKNPSKKENKTKSPKIRSSSSLNNYFIYGNNE